jgi:hypothetical protein
MQFQVVGQATALHFEDCLSRAGARVSMLTAGKAMS